jgi:hypothetical protein
MKAYDYGKKRLKGLSHKAALSMLKSAYIGDTVAYALVVGVVIFLSLNAAANTIEEGRQKAANVASEASAETVDRLERVVITCLNGGALNIDGTAFSCKAESLEQKL